MRNNGLKSLFILVSRLVLNRLCVPLQPSIILEILTWDYRATSPNCEVVVVYGGFVAGRTEDLG
jgi:hypothetical protein